MTMTVINILIKDDVTCRKCYLYDLTNETAGAFVPAQILYDAFRGKYHNATGVITLLFIIWESFFFGGLSITTSAARVVYALSRDEGIPFSSIWRKVHPKHKVPSNAVWLCAVICILLGLPILKVNVVFTAITSICTIGWVGGYAVPIFARMVMAEKNFKLGPFYLGKARKPVCLAAFLWICYTCCVFLLPTFYPITGDTFDYAPVALGVGLSLIMLWWMLDARKWFRDQNIEGKAGIAPTVEELAVALKSHNLFIYIGHGSGAQYIPRHEIQKLENRAATLLMGCISGSMSLNGQCTPQGTHLSYLSAGSPVIVVNLWEVTDKDIDRFGKAMLDAWLRERSSPSVVCA